MMMTNLTHPQAQALTALIATIRPDWDATGILAALRIAKDRGTATEVMHAAITAASTPTVRTPAVMGMAGPHWTTPTSAPRAPSTVPDASAARCEIPGHEGEVAHNCRACRSERLGTDTPADDTLAIPAGQAALNAKGAALVRAALTAPAADATRATGTTERN